MSTRKFSRRNFIKTASLTVAGGMLAACTTPTAAPTDAPKAVEPAAATATTAPTEASAAVAEATATTAPAATATAAPTELSPVELTWHMVGGGEPQDLATVEAAINEYLSQKINATLKFVHSDWGSYGDRMTMVHNSGEPVDIEFSATWTNNYNAGVANGVFVDISDMIKTYAPNTWASMPEKTWNAGRIGGKLYGVINQQRFPKLFGITVRKDLAEKYGFDLDAITGYDDPKLVEFMQKVKDGGDVKYVSNGPWVDPTFLGYDPLGPAVVKVDDTSAKAVNFAATPEFANYMKLIRTWSEGGFFPVEPIPDEDAAIKAGEVGMFVARNQVGPYTDIALKARYGYEWLTKVMHKPMLNTNGVAATISCVSVQSKNPERALMLLDLVNTDEYLYNLICYGVEGTHWQWADEDKKLIEKIADSGYDPNTNWAFGNTFNGYYTDPLMVGQWEMDAELNNTATPSPVLGFAFDQKPVETTLATIQPLIDPIFAELYGGLAADVDAKIAEALEVYSANGGDAVLEEVNNQIAAWQQTM